jgi:very-short-patch-repair endonuclease
MASHRAKLLRQNATSAERLLWQALRDRALKGAKFRRQHPIGAYVADFVCLERKLVIEADGGQHEPAADLARSRQLEALGFHILRFWNNEILQNIEGVLHVIEQHLDEDT